MRTLLHLVGLGLLTGCPSPTVDEAACAEICAQPDNAEEAGTPDGATAGGSADAGIELSAFEEELLGRVVEDLRAGVRPMDDQSLGICAKGDSSRTCEQMLGMEPGELTEGEYILFGSFKVPDVGERGTWKIRLEGTCTTTAVNADGEERTFDREWKPRDYDVVFAGRDRGYTLSPLRRIKSPNDGGRQECTFRIVAPHPDGDEVYEGAYTVPAAEG